MRQLAALLSISLTLIPLVSLAEAPSSPIPSPEPLNLELLKNPTGLVVTADTIDQKQLTTPSLWWAKDNLETNKIFKKLLDNWIAYPPHEKEAARVDFVVNQQFWSLLDSLERYAFVNHLGTAARKYGYNVRIFNNQKENIANYTCNFSVVPALCRIQWTSAVK
jgi:hypothetical protein